jgi:accessory gene regulator B
MSSRSFYYIELCLKERRLQELMYKKLVVKFFREVINQAENEDEKEVVVYGLEVMMATIVNLLVLLFMGFISNNLLGTIIFIGCFCMIRGQAGGFHANSYLTCLLCSVFTFGFIILINPYVTREYNTVLIIGTGVSYVVTLMLAPILNGKRTFSQKEIKSIKRKVVIFLILEASVTLALYQTNYELYKFAIYAMITEGVFGIMGKFKYWNLNKNTMLKKVMNLSLGVALLTGAGTMFDCFS